MTIKPRKTKTPQFLTHSSWTQLVLYLIEQGVTVNIDLRGHPFKINQGSLNSLGGP